MKKFVILVTVLGAWAGSARAASYAQPLLLSATFPQANQYYIAYFDFLSATAQAVPANSFLEYDVYIPADSAAQSAGIDFAFSGGKNLRDYQNANLQYLRDQNYLRAHPFSDLSAYAKGQWYHRKIDVGAVYGRTFSEACLSTDTGNGGNGAPANLAGAINAYFDNVQFTNAYGSTLLNLYSDGGSLALPGAPVKSTTIFSNASGYTTISNTVAVASALGLAAAPASVMVGQSLTLTAAFTAPGGVASPTPTCA